MKKVRLDALAQDELDAAVEWYDSQTGQSQIADELLGVVNAAIARLAESPRAFGYVPDVPTLLGVRRCQLQRFPYALVFVELAEEIRVLAFAHGRRRPGYWRTRLLPR